MFPQYLQYFSDICNICDDDIFPPLSQFYFPRPQSSAVKIFHSVDLLFLRIPTLVPISSCICHNFSSHTWQIFVPQKTNTFCHSGFVSGICRILHMHCFVREAPLQKQCDRPSLEKIKLTKQCKINSIFHTNDQFLEWKAPKKRKQSRPQSPSLTLNDMFTNSVSFLRGRNLCPEN